MNEHNTKILTSSDRVNLQGRDFNRTLSMLFLKTDKDAETLLQMITSGHKLAASIDTKAMGVICLLEALKPAQVQTAKK